jgi:predicted enzyme related to lactoylglutathione lyase
MTAFDAYPPGTFSWADLMAKDIAAARRFYTALFGWQDAEQDTNGGPPYVMFLNGDAPVAGLGALPAEMQAQGVPPAWNSYVTVDDIQAAITGAQTHGGGVSMPPMQIFDAGHMAVITDPEGAALSLWQPLEHKGAGVCNEPGSLCWNELACRDIDGARDFYAAVFGWDYRFNEQAPTTYYVIRNDGNDNGGFLQMNEQWGDMPSHWSVYFAVDDIDARVARVKELGGTLHADPFEVPVGRLTVVQDDQGAHFYMLQLKE